LILSSPERLPRRRRGVWGRALPTEKEFPTAEGLTLPPNVFDRFVCHQIADL
jgi:hypothetical protein